MSDLPYSDPSNPALPSPLFSDITAVRGDHLRANNAAIFADLNALNARNPELVALTSGSFKTAALAYANTYNGRSLFTCTVAVTDTPSAAAWRIIGYWNPTDSSGRFVAMADASLETWEINYSGGAWGTWTRLTDASGNVTRDIIGDVTGNADTATLAAAASSIKETGAENGTLRWKIIEIGDWNMDTYQQKYVAHGLTRTKIRSINIIIRGDSDGDYYPLNYTTITNGLTQGKWILPVGSETLIEMQRLHQGLFDSTFFDSTSYNRGWITIGYID